MSASPVCVGPRTDVVAPQLSRTTPQRQSLGLRIILVYGRLRLGYGLGLPGMRGFNSSKVHKSIWKSHFHHGCGTAIRSQRNESESSQIESSPAEFSQSFRTESFQSSQTERPWSPLGVSHEIGEVIAGKYKIIGVLGSGGVGTTYEAEIEDGVTVALKAMSLRNMKAWKNLELFEREARVLKSLRHPNIPEYVDYFEIDSTSDRVFYLAQRVAQGKSLADLVQDGWRFTEEEVIQIGLQVLEVLKYLCSLRPPVYHRDIKPENIILDRDTSAVKVVDFGAVQDAASVTVIGSTVVGTYGYMAPEQFQNRATAQTDLYALGGTLLFLLSGRSPSSFPQKRLKIDFSSVSASPRLRAVIGRLMEPAPEDRFQSPADVIRALETDRESDYTQSQLMTGSRFNDGIVDIGQTQGKRLVRKPAGTKVELRRTPGALEITIPPVGLNSETAGTGSFAVAWSSILAVWTKAALGRGGPGVGSIALFSLPFWFVGVRLMKMTLSRLTVAVSLRIEDGQYSIERKIGDVWNRRVFGDTQDINSVEVSEQEKVRSRDRSSTTSACRIVEGVNVHEFGTGLQPIEQKWIVQEIRNFLTEHENDQNQ